MKSQILVCLLSFLLVACGQQNSGDASSEPEPATVEISAAVMPQLPPGQSTAAVYLKLENKSAQTLVINHIVSSVSDHIEVHRNIYQEGVMQMRSVRHASIAPNSTMLFAPGGYHLMLFDVNDGLAVGDHFPLTIEFQGGVKAEGTVSVEAIAP